MPSTNPLHQLTQIQKKTGLVYPELSYKIVGAVFEVFNRLGFGYAEKVYQEALVEELGLTELSFKRENYVRVNYKGRKIGSLFRDFIVEGKIVLELKVANDIYESHVKQLLAYLRDSGCKLGILVAFSPRGIIFRRVVN